MSTKIKTLLINNLRECLSYLSPGDNYTSDMAIEQQVPKDKDEDIAKLLTSIISDTKLAKELLTERTTAKQYRQSRYDTLF